MHVLPTAAPKWSSGLGPGTALRMRMGWTPAGRMNVEFDRHWFVFRGLDVMLVEDPAQIDDIDGQSWRNSAHWPETAEFHTDRVFSSRGDGELLIVLWVCH